MSPKEGRIFDYDLHASDQPSAHNQTCVVCGASPATYQWSDLNGEGMCTRCGTPYQLMNGSDEMRAEGKYPYLNVRDAWVPVVRRYFQETGAFACLGTFMGVRPEAEAFFRWVEENNAAPPKSSEVV